MYGCALARSFGVGATAFSGTVCYFCGQAGSGHCPTHFIVFCRAHGGPDGCVWCREQRQAEFEAASRTEALSRASQPVLTRQSWSDRFFFLAILLAIPTGLLIYFFETSDWRNRTLRWAFEHEQFSIAVRIAEGSYAGIRWDGWAAIGVALVATLVYFSIRLRTSASRLVAATPGLGAHVSAIRAERRRNAAGLVGCLFLIPLVLIAISVFAAFSQGDGRGNDDDD